MLHKLKRIDMNLIQKIILILIMNIISSELFNLYDWRFWIISTGTGICLGFHKIKK